MTSARDAQDIDSVFDFLYVDHVRIGAFLAQLSALGHVESTTVEDEVTRHTEGKTGLTANVMVAGGSGEVGAGYQAGTKKSATYNPLWFHARHFLDEVDERKWLMWGIEGAALGTLVLVSGSLEIRDLRLMQGLWQPLLRGQLSPPENRSQERIRGSRGKSAEDKSSQMKAIGDFVAKMPHAVQATLRTSGATIWFTLDPDRMTVSPENIALKHGFRLTGNWTALGVLDALPDASTIESDAQFTPEPSISAGVGALSAMLRMTLGRGAEEHGITPLLVFRKVGGDP